MWQTFTKSVRKAFTDAADQYDILTSLHKEIGRELVKKNIRREANFVLDVGTGTGYIANKAKFFFPNATIVGLDIAEGMIEKAAQTHEGIKWIQADGESLPFNDQTFDIIFSNLAYQWIPDLPKAFAQARRVLADGGSFNGTLFGAKTCEELFSSLAAVNPSLSIRRLVTVDDVRKTLNAVGFRDVRVDYELIKVEFKDIWELLGWFKSIGANQLPREEAFIGKDTLSKAGEYYQQHYPYNDGICASFEVIWFEARNVAKTHTL